MDGLFRKEAIQEQTHRLHGDVIVLPKIRHSITLCFILTCVTAVLIWGSLSTYARKESIQGWLEPSSGIASIHSELAGIVEKVLVDQGEVVAEGQPLVVIARNRMLAGGVHLDQRLINELNAQKKRLELRLVLTNQSYQIRAEQLNQQLRSARHEVSELHEQIQAVQERYALLSSQMERMEKLRVSGHVSDFDLDNSKQQMLAILGDKKELSRQGNTAASRIEQLESQIKLLPIERENTLTDIHTRISLNTREASTLKSDTEQILFATTSGVITNLQVKVGQQISPTIPILSIAPQNSNLDLHFLIPVKAIGFIEEGQILKIRYDAFPYQKIGLYSGILDSISTTILLPQELSSAPVRPTGPFYKATAKLHETSVSAYGKQFPLRPGMTLQADIKLDDRSFIEWLLEPIYSVKGSL